MNDTTTTQMDLTTALGLVGLTDTDTAGWIEVTVEGGPTVYHNARIGYLVIGKTPLGYDQPVLYVNSGSPVLGYHFDTDGNLLLTALVAGRWNLQDGDLLPEVMGGFNDGKTLPKGGAMRELFEEGGIDPDDVLPTIGTPFIGDRAFFFKKIEDGNNVFMFELSPEHIVHIAMSPQLQLMPWEVFVAETVDGITMGAIARVMATLSTQGVLKVCKA